MPNPYINKVTANNVTLIDLTADTAIVSDVAAGKYFHLATGERVQGTSTGGNDFVVTLAYNDQTEMWEPDKTLAEIDAAYVGGKSIAFQAFDEWDNSVPVSSSYDKFGSNMGTLYYSVNVPYTYESLEEGFECHWYSLDTTGVHESGTSYYRNTSIATAVAADVAQGKTFFSASGYETGTASGGGGSGLEYEAGTWTPASDIDSYEIQFSNSHSTAPFMYLVADATNTYSDVKNSIYSVAFVDWFAAFNASFNTTESAHRHGRMQYSYRSSATAVSDGGTNLSDSTSQGTTASTLYWANTTRIRAYTNNTSRYWRAGRTYKWIAVWAPTS